MNRTQKILIAVGVGVGLAYMYRKYMMPKKQKNTNISKNDIDSTPISMPMDDNLENRDEKEQYIIENLSASEEEEMTGMDGVRFVWNPKLGKFYPQGTLTEGKEPEYFESIFYSADGELQTNIPNSVQVAEASLSDLSDDEVQMVYKITKIAKENPEKSQNIDAVIRQMKITNPRLIQVIKSRLNKRMNDIKIAKKDKNWKQRWMLRKRKLLAKLGQLKNRRKKFKQITGLNPIEFRKASAKVCGVLKPNVRYSKARLIEYKGCQELLLQKMRKQQSQNVHNSISNASVSEKANIDNYRQNQFAQQVVNRQGAGQFAGKRWDGSNNNFTEMLVSEGLE